MAVKIVLITDGVEVPNTSGWITQQCIRELIEGTNLGLISKTTDVDHHPFAKVMIVHHRMKVVLAGILRVLMDSLIFVSSKLWK